MSEVNVQTLNMSCGSVHFASAADGQLPANGGLRVLSYDYDGQALEEARQLAERMTVKHRLYKTGFRGGKIVANVAYVCPDTLEEVTQTVAEELNRRHGDFYTGADLNYGEAQVQKLFEDTPYVLAAVGSGVHYAAATAAGAYGAVRTAKSFLDTSCAKIFVHGAGAVGSRVASDLAASGDHVFVYDKITARGDLEGVVNLADAQSWVNMPWDIVVLASGSHVMTAEIAEKLSAKAIVCVANLPFRPTAKEILEEKGTLIFDEGIASAGAVIADSIEFYNKTAWHEAPPEDIYEFISNSVSEECFRKLAYFNLQFSPIGKHFLLGV
ncbi:Rossmann-fold NAD(P)-binding domain-containing protein [Flexibacterium corallicola]|uniref:hypothetical protein n=1 Tax=Flexibacterium corallicola TaxID=3037259 RepID=UPI00286F8555|nr:hypothetical protein [Pseudovibrio sp. M1P-2-3]